MLKNGVVTRESILIDCAPSESILSTAAYLASKYVLVPVKPEFLATIGLPLLARSLDEFKQSRSNHEIELAGIVFNDSDPQHIRPEHNLSRQQVKLLAQKHGWKVFKNECRHSRSYAAGARKGQSIFGTKHARKAVKAEFRKVGDEFLARIGL